MKHDQALTIRALTEAMLNANTLNDNKLQAALSETVIGILRPQAPEVGAEEPTDERPPTIHELVNDAIGDNCPCCIIVEAVTTGEELPYGDEQFLYSIGHLSSYNELASIMQSVAIKFGDYRQNLAGESLDIFAKRLGEFTQASMTVRERMVAEGKAPELPPVTQQLAGVLQALMARGQQG